MSVPQASVHVAAGAPPMTSSSLQQYWFAPHHLRPVHGQWGIGKFAIVFEHAVDNVHVQPLDFGQQTSPFGWQSSGVPPFGSEGQRFPPTPGFASPTTPSAGAS